MADVIFQKFWSDKKTIIKICNDMIDSCCKEEFEDTRIADYQALQKKMEKWNNRYDNLLNMRMNGEIEKDRYDEKREALLKEQEKLQEEFAEYDAQEDVDEDLYKKKIQLLKAGLDAFVDEIEVHKEYFIWRLNISPDDAIMKVSGRVNNYTVSQTDRDDKDNNGNERTLKKSISAVSDYSDTKFQHRQQLPTNKKFEKIKML